MATENTTDTLDRAASRLLRLLTILFVGVTVACFAQSYRQLFDWATTHRVPMWQAWAWPAGVDAPIIMGEILLYVAIVRGWPFYVKALGALVALGGFAASLAANVGFLPAGSSVSDRLTAGMAPVVASISLGVALVALKYVTRAQNGNGAKRVTHGDAPATKPPMSALPPTAAQTDELAARRSKHDVAGARAAIARGRDAGRLPSAYSLAMTYLGGDATSRRRGDERLAKQLLAEGAQ